jgi:hypothetical protein
MPADLNPADLNPAAPPRQLWKVQLPDHVHARTPIEPLPLTVSHIYFLLLHCARVPGARKSLLRNL